MTTHSDHELTWEEVKAMLPRAAARAEQRFHDGMKIGVGAGIVTVFVSRTVAEYRARAVAREAAKDYRDRMNRLTEAYNDTTQRLRKELGVARRELTDVKQARTSLAIKYDARGNMLDSVRADVAAVNKRLKELYEENDKLKERLKEYKGTDKCLSSCKRAILVKENEQLREDLHSARAERDSARLVLEDIKERIYTVIGE